MQLHAIFILARFIGSKEKIAMINSFVYFNFNCCPLAWHFYSCKSSQKIEKFKSCCLRLVLDDYESDYRNFIKKKMVPPQWKLRDYEFSQQKQMQKYDNMIS